MFFLSISFNLFLIIFLSDLLSNIPNSIINFLILIIIDFISLTGSLCRWFKYSVSLWCFWVRIKTYKSSDLFNPVKSTFRSWTSFLKLFVGKSFNLLISFNSFRDMFSFLVRLDCFNLFTFFKSLIVWLFCLFCRFLYNSSFMFADFCLWWYLNHLLIWFGSFYEYL